MNHFLMVGAGGTGSYLMPILHRYLVSTYGEDFLLAVIDNDVIGVENLARQAHEPSHVGVNKAVALCQGRANTIPISAYLGPDNIDTLIQAGSTVIITVDNMPCRARIEAKALSLPNVTVINAGNEEHTGSVQLMVRRANENVTPPIGFLHPEIAAPGEDRALMTCEAIAALPGGGQTAIANQTAATFSMVALNHLHQNTALRWHEVQFDALTGEVEMIDYRETKAWTLFNSSDSSEASSSPPQVATSSASTRRTPRNASTTRPSTPPTST